MIAKREGCDINHKNKKGDDALSLACTHAMHEVATVLIAHGANGDTQHEVLLTTPLMRSAGLADAVASMQLCELLLGVSVNVNCLDGMGRSALFRAVSTGNRNVVELLMQHGSDAKFEDRNGESPLVHAWQLGHKSESHRELAQALAELSRKSESTRFRKLSRLWHPSPAWLNVPPARHVPTDSQPTKKKGAKRSSVFRVRKSFSNGSIFRKSNLLTTPRSLHKSASLCSFSVVPNHSSGVERRNQGCAPTMASSISERSTSCSSFFSNDSGNNSKLDTANASNRSSGLSITGSSSGFVVAALSHRSRSLLVATNPDRDLAI